MNIANLIAAAMAGYTFRSYVHNFNHVRWWTTQKAEIRWDGELDSPRMHAYIRSTQQDSFANLVFTIIFVVLAVL